MQVPNSLRILSTKSTISQKLRTAKIWNSVLHSFQNIVHLLGRKKEKNSHKKFKKRILNGHSCQYRLAGFGWLNSNFLIKLIKNLIMIHATKWRRKQNGGENKMAAKTKWRRKLALVTYRHREIFSESC